MNGTFVKKYQSGVALVVSLLLLFVMTLVAVSTFSATHIQERSANNLRLQSMAFEAASAGASNAIQFFVANPTIGADELCGALNHTGWDSPSAWIDMGTVGDANLQQRLYCIADAYPCTDDEAVDCGIRPPRSQLFVHSQGTVQANDGTVVAVRDVEVRLDIGADWDTGDGCGALCFPGCDFYDPKQGQCGGAENDECLDFPSSNVFQVDGDGGPAITVGCADYIDEFEDAIGSRMGNYEGEIAAEGAESPWDSPTDTAAFRDAVKADALIAQDAGTCMTTCIHEGDYVDNGNTEYGTYDDPQILFIDGDADLGGGVSGAGILFVTGKLTWNGTPNWHGLMVALGGNFAIDGGGTGGNPGSKEQVVSGGSVVVLNLSDDDSTFGTVGFQNTGGGNALYKYDCDMLERARNMLLGGTAQGLWNPDCDRGPENIFDVGPTELIIASWRENIGWREEHWGE
jgi:hypothetical protein